MASGVLDMGPSWPPGPGTTIDCHQLPLLMGQLRRRGGALFSHALPELGIDLDGDMHGAVPVSLGLHRRPGRRSTRGSPPGPRTRLRVGLSIIGEDCGRWDGRIFSDHAISQRSPTISRRPASPLRPPQGSVNCQAPGGSGEPGPCPRAWTDQQSDLGLDTVEVAGELSRDSSGHPPAPDPPNLRCPRMRVLNAGQGTGVAGASSGPRDSAVGSRG